MMKRPEDASPIFADIDSEHARMRDLLAEVHRVLDRRSDTQETVVQALSSLIEYLRDHFRHEDEGGFFGQITAIAPRLSERADAVSHEHHELLASIKSFRDAARDAPPNAEWWDRLNTEFHQLMKSLMAHEHREQELLQEAFTDDIGTGD